MKWKPVKNFETFYSVSDTGEIKSLIRKNGMGSRKEERILKPNFKKGYVGFALGKNNKMFHFLAHRIVATAFIPNPKKFPQVNHKNGNKHDNRVRNLEWCDHKYNATHAKENGLTAHGEKNINAKLSRREALAIRKLHPRITAKELSKIFEIAESQTFKIINRTAWKNI